MSATRRPLQRSYFGFPYPDPVQPDTPTSSPPLDAKCATLHCGRRGRGGRGERRDPRTHMRLYARARMRGPLSLLLEPTKRIVDGLGSGSLHVPAIGGGLFNKEATSRSMTTTRDEQREGRREERGRRRRQQPAIPTPIKCGRVVFLFCLFFVASLLLDSLSLL